MSFSTSISAATAATPVTSARSTRPAAGPATAVAAPAAVTVDTMPVSPPPEVLDAIGAAAETYDRLASAGQHLQFAIDPPTGKVAISVTDPAGNVLHTLSPSAALAVASGEPLPEH